MGCSGSSEAAAKEPQSSQPASAEQPTDPAGVVITGELISAPTRDRVPQRTKAFFHRLDRDKDNCVTLDELQAGFESEFKDGLTAHAKEAIVTLFEAHAVEVAGGLFGGTKRFLKPGSFNRFYAEILFRHFDANNNGTLDLEEAQAALRFLKKKPEGGEKPDVQVAFPSNAYTETGELRLPKSWFFGLYQSME